MLGCNDEGKRLKTKALNITKILNVMTMFKTKRKKGNYKDERANVNVCYKFTKMYDHLENGRKIE